MNKLVSVFALMFACLWSGASFADYERRGELQQVIPAKRLAVLNARAYPLAEFVKIHLEGTEHASIVNLRPSMKFRFTLDSNKKIVEMWQLPDHEVVAD